MENKRFAIVSTGVIVALLGINGYQARAMRIAAQDVQSYWTALEFIGGAFKSQREMLAACKAGTLDAYKAEAKKKLMERLGK